MLVIRVPSNVTAWEVRLRRVAPVTSLVTPLSDTGASLILASQRGIPSLDGLGSWSACSRGNSFHSPMAALATASAIPEYHAASPP